VLIIAFPTEYEAAEFVAGLSGRKKEIISGVPCYRGNLEKAAVLVIISGMGGKMSAQRVRAVLSREQADIFIMAGFAGALNTELKKGQVIVADRYSSRDLFDFIRLIPGYDIASLHTADRVIATPQDKTELSQQTGCQLVDMEMSAVAEVVRGYGVDILGIRVISDEMDEAVPVEILAHGYSQAKGRTTPLKMTLYLMTHPWRIGELKSFLSPLAEARRNLTRFVNAVVHELAEL
jgi:adenosylhomocysteine nucleosidase